MWIFIIILGFAIAYIVAVYNGFVSLLNRTRNAWADIDVQLKRRHDLVPNLVSTVQGYATHEKSVLEDVAKLRSRATELDSINERSGAETQLAGAIRTLFAVAESYPDLRADRSFRDLQSQLTMIEDHIQYARRYYNAVVRDINTRLEIFPSNLIGRWFGFRRQPYFQIEEQEREPVEAWMKEGR